MPDAPAWAAYRERVQRVRDYIEDHLDDEIDLNKLADVACLSPYHWHRIYRAIHGETIAATVKRLRLNRAAEELMGTSRPIAEVARRSGYPNVQSFTRIFSSAYGKPPARYRREGGRAQRQPISKGRQIMDYKVDIREIEPLSGIAVDHTGPYPEIGDAFNTLFGWLGPRNLAGSASKMLAVYYDDPTAVAPEKLRSAACAIFESPPKSEAPARPIEIDGGRYAVLRHKGPYAELKTSYDWLYGTWLPESGVTVRDAPPFEEYVNNPMNAEPEELLTDIFMPIE